MRLKRIELAGFKSFVDPTKIDLGDGLTAIVGPNGSGKSNIVDAIRWVLGEHSAKHLRGGVMDDLIFQGSDTRPPVGLCDVELTFETSPGRLPSPYHELSEIRIRRRMMREGGSDAYINGKMVRLKDVVDVFLDTGVSTRAYAIVEQGSIARMITSKPEERRMMLEEAAGIMKYRARRREAERKMKDTAQNLERVMDLLEEVRSQCRSLKQQASRAGRFKTLQEEFQQAQALSMGIRYRQVEASCHQIKQQLLAARTQEAAAAQEHTQAERQLIEARKELTDHEPEAQAMQDALRAGEQQRAALQQQAERLAGERRLLHERKQTLEQRLDDARQRITRLDTDIKAIDQHILDQDDHTLDQAVEAAKVSMETALNSYHEQCQKRDQLLAELERIKSMQAAMLRREKQVADALHRLDQRRIHLEGKQTDFEQQIANIKHTLAQANSDVQRAETEKKTADAHLEAMQAKLDQTRHEQAQAADTLSTQDRAVRQLRGNLQELRARAASRSIPDKLREALRSKGIVWVDESLEAPAGLELAVAAALRGQVADAVLPVNPDAHLLDECMAQASDAPIAFFAGQSNDANEGSLAQAMDLSPVHPLYAIFAHTLLLDDLLNAQSIMAAHPAAWVAAVNRDGWRMEASGWLIPPAHNDTARRLKMQRELRVHEQKLPDAEQKLTALEQSLARAENALTKQQQAWQQAHVKAVQANSDSQARQAHAIRQQTELEAMQARLERLRSEMAELVEEHAQWSAQTIDQETQISDQIDVAQQALEHQTGLQHQSENTLNQHRNSLAAAEQALALQRQAMRTFQQDRQRLAAEQQQLQQQTIADTTRLNEAIQALKQAEDQSGMDHALNEVAAEVERIHQALNSLRQQGHVLQQGVHKLEVAEHQLRNRKQQHTEACQQQEIKITAETTRLHDMEADIEQRSQRPVQTLLQLLDQHEGSMDAETVLHQAQVLEDRLNRFGAVNLLAIDEYEQASEREQFLSAQAQDLESALHTLENTIERINRTTRQRFKDTFDRTNTYFQETFPRLFGGGRGELRLDSDDVLNAGVEVIAQPPGKHLQDIGLLSGGEKALTAVALVFAIFRLKPAPFCILDEVDAPLDDANVGRFGEMVKELCTEVQFLSITHNKVSMQMANRIIGVSMPEPGVSRIVGVDMEAMEAS